VVLLDLELPGLDAHGLLRTIRDEDDIRNTLVFAMVSIRNLRNERLLSEFDEQVDKPLRLDQLLSRLQKTLPVR
jgi:CheY-like chemotaxis protein